MITFIRGSLVEATSAYTVVEAYGIGYRVLTPVSVLSQLPAPKEEVLLHTTLVTRELQQTLYGFLETSQRDLFEVLLGVSSIGPKTALSIIGHLPIDQLSQAVANHKTEVICKIPGIGRKTAERLILEIKDKLPQVVSGHTPLHTIDPQQQLVQDAMSALINLGYNQNVAEQAIKKTLKEHPEHESLAQLIPLALRQI